MNKFELSLVAYEHELITLDDLILEMDNNDRYKAANDDVYGGYESELLLN